MWPQGITLGIVRSCPNSSKQMSQLDAGARESGIASRILLDRSLRSLRHSYPLTILNSKFRFWMCQYKLADLTAHYCFRYHDKHGCIGHLVNLSKVTASMNWENKVPQALVSLWVENIRIGIGFGSGKRNISLHNNQTVHPLQHLDNCTIAILLI